MTTADNQPLGQALAENQAFLQTMFGGSSDFYTKSFTICGCRCCIAMFAGLSSPEKLCIMVLHALGQGVPGYKAGPQRDQPQRGRQHARPAGCLYRAPAQ